MGRKVPEIKVVDIREIFVGRYRMIYNISKSKTIEILAIRHFPGHYQNFKMTINEAQDELIEDFDLFDEWESKYEYIIDLGKQLPDLDEKYKTDENIIKGCQSLVWLHAYMDGGLLKFEADSNAIIVKGLVNMLVKVLSGHTPEEIAKADVYFMEKVGLHQHLAQTRSNGLASMLKQMKAYGVAYQARPEAQN